MCVGEERGVSVDGRGRAEIAAASFVMLVGAGLRESVVCVTRLQKLLLDCAGDGSGVGSFTWKALLMWKVRLPHPPFPTSPHLLHLQMPNARKVYFLSLIQDGDRLVQGC